jgi:hypothetical protein
MIAGNTSSRCRSNRLIPAYMAVRIPILYDPETKQELGWPFDRAEVEDFVCHVARM